MKIALVHDWLTGMRGGEKVLLELLRLFPDAPAFTLLWNRGSVHPEIEARVRGVSFLQSLPGAARLYRYYLPLFPAAARSLDLAGFDVVLSSSHAVAHGARLPPEALHVCYLHTPMRYLWDSAGDYFHFGRARRSKRAALALLAPYLRRFDLRAASRVNFFLANSENVSDRIRRCYGADAVVIHPPVDTDFFTPAVTASGDYYLLVSSLEPYKRVDLAIDAFATFARGSRRLLVAGGGTLERQLRARARPPVELLGAVSDERLRELYRGCRALIFPGREDFGMVPVEAQACGRPVICFGEGGALETVADGRTGIHFRPQTPAALAAAVAHSETIEWDHAAIRAHSLQFSRAQFRDKMKAFWTAHVSHDWPFEQDASRDARRAHL